MKLHMCLPVPNQSAVVSNQTINIHTAVSSSMLANSKAKHKKTYLTIFHSHSSSNILSDLLFIYIYIQPQCLYAFLFICVVKLQCVSPHQQGFSHETL